MGTLFEEGRKRVLAGEYPDGWMKGTLYIRITSVLDGIVYFVIGVADPNTGDKLFEHDEVFTIKEGEEVKFLGSDDAVFTFQVRINVGAR